MFCVLKKMNSASFSVKTLLVMAMMITASGLAHAQPEIVSVNRNDSEVTVSFSKPVDPLSVSENTFIMQAQLPGVGYGTVSGKVDYNDGIATFSSSSDFRSGLHYTVLITTGVKDQDGNPLQVCYTWMFTLMTQNFAVISDPHYYDSDLGVSGSAFEAYLTRDRKLLRESEAILKATAESIQGIPDINFVIVPGDLTKDGELSSHQEFADYMRILEDNGIQVYVVPGNHDINNPHAMSYSGDTALPADSVTPGQFAEIYSDYGYDQAIYRDPDSLSYVAEPGPGIWLFALDACQYDENETLGEPVVAGRLSQERLDWILEKLSLAKAQNKKVISMMHHGILEHFTGQSQTNPGTEYVIEDWQNVSETLAKAGLNLIFTGHYHAQDAVTETWDADGETISLTDVETGSLVTYPSPYRRVALSPDNTVTIETEFISEIDYDTGPVSFPDYSENFLSEGLNTMAHYSLTLPADQGGYGMTPEQANMIAPYIANAFKAHYTGDETPDQETLAAINTFLESQDPTTRFLGQSLYALWTDLVPGDNTLQIEDGS